MRQGKWKLVRPYVTRDVPGKHSGETAVLYDLEKDPFEQRDVSDSNKTVYKTMSVRLEAWSRQVEYMRLNNSNTK